jgi:DNA-binding IclR family transcriptional regulator
MRWPAAPGWPCRWGRWPGATCAWCTTCSARTGRRSGCEELPLHATALGKCLLAFAPVATPPVRDLELARWTGRTCTTVAALDAHLAAARQRGWASDLGEYEAGVGAAAAPLRASGGTVVGALSVLGPVEELFGVGGELRRPVAEQLVADAREVSGALLQAHASAEWQGRT